LIKKVTPELTPELILEIPPKSDLMMLISIHDLFHFFVVHVPGEVLTGRQLDISSCKS